MRKKAYSGSNEENIKQKIVDMPVPKITDHRYSSDLLSLYEYCMIKDPDQRASIDEILGQNIVIE